MSFLQTSPNRSPHATTETAPKSFELALLFSVFIIASCGLLYELLAGALASYILGDSILQFSTIIGTYLFAMGCGSFLSRYIEHYLTEYFLRIELFIALIGGFLPIILFLTNAYSVQFFHFILYTQIFLIGLFVGLEIPLVMRILKRYTSLKELVAQVLTFDYLGALAVSILFPLFFVPYLGLIRTGLVFGIFNALVACWTLYLFYTKISHLKYYIALCIITLCALVLGLIYADKITTLSEEKLFNDTIVFSATTRYQRIVLTKNGDIKNGKIGYRLFLNGNLQFSQRDEYRYHEALVHPAMLAHGAPKRVAILGGGDGMAAREVLKYPSVESITLVELDPQMTHIFKERPDLKILNHNALNSPKIHIINTDAFTWLNNNSNKDLYFDIIIVDFPDPTNYAIGKLYTYTFYSLLEQHLSSSGYAVIQTTSPLLARQSFWTVVHTVQATGLSTTPYHVHVPSFGEWGFVMASRRSPLPSLTTAVLPQDLKFLTQHYLPQLFIFPHDMSPVSTGINHLSNQILVQTYEKEWGAVLH